MFNSFILEIPDLRSVLHPKDIMAWEVVYAKAELVFGKISWQISSDGNCYSIHNPRLFPDYLEQVQVDFKMNQIIFCKRQLSDEEFHVLVAYIMEKVSIYINPNEMHFMVTAPRHRHQRTRSKK
ncbi:hypothetical protein A1A1_06062 [Planococcus antarcticus DSM 14505]|uniref:Uncharacterized protein n=1 Tax=Planococcus antarcticus DSM 14505 TaxID=1185653 RepID=A0A1C7DEU8_9BACL|nr:hypothetical protein [Planococcus antarcticus]ANU10070.1 hypothetical protein BBH88_07025 [Planococcus antarcticus DSM 14505]EIM07344.1 hypothetical protein A1A1_06062 [Planococcus antarcticus DSM 14505]